MHLHTHSDFSVLDGLGKPEKYVERAKQLGQNAIAITDHGNLFGAHEFYSVARKNGVEPVLGCEFYYVSDVPSARERKGHQNESDPMRYHLTVLARGEKGFRSLSELSTESNKNFYYKPLVDRQILEDADLKNLVILSGCASSILSKMVLRDMDEAREELFWWTKTVPNFWIEVQDHGIDHDRAMNEGLISLAKEANIGWVITNDPHYVDEGDCIHHEALLAIQTNSDIDDPNRFKFDGSGYHLKSAQEMADAWKGYPKSVLSKGMKASVEIAKDCMTRIPQFEKRSWSIPSVPGVKDSQALLSKLVRKGLRDRGLMGYPEYVKRAKHELKVIEESKIADFLLIAADAVEWAEDQGIPVGPGRGSVCGSLVCFAIGIHKVDSIRYGLLFERFLNPSRPSMPDIDIDFGQERRDELFGYVKKRYGEENVLHVSAMQTMQVKRMFTALAKAHGVPYQEAVKISKGLDPNDEELVLPEEIETRFPEMVEQIKALQGIRSGISSHPAGVIIGAPEHEISKVIPQAYVPSSKKWVAQYDLEAVGKLGYLKQDFLGLRTLDTVQMVLDLVKEHTGEEIDPYSWVPDEEEDDELVYQMLASGDTSGVFQLEGDANSRGIQDVGCSRFMDIAAVIALYRTGPLRAGFHTKFIKNRNAREALHPLLEKSLAMTHGVIIYQEQVMEISKDVAGFSWELVDDMKEAVAKKKPELMATLKEPFLDGASLVIGIKEAKKLWKAIEGFQGYGFNASHAVGYGLLSYITARLKYLHPLEFYVALICTVEDKDKRSRYLREASRRGFRILPPDVNRSEVRASPVYGDKPGIRFGLQDLAGLGPRKVKRIINSRPFRQPHEVAAVVDKGTYKSLVESGAMRSIGIPGNSESAERLVGWSFRDRTVDLRPGWENLLVEPDMDDESYCQVIGELIKVSEAKTKGGKPYQTWTIRWDPSTEWKARLWSDSKRFWGVPIGKFVRVQGTWDPRWENLTCGRLHTIYVWNRSRWVRADKWTDQDLRVERKS